MDPTYSSSSSSNSYNLKPSKEKNTVVKSNTSKHVSEEIELWSSVARAATTSTVTRDEEAPRKSWSQSFQKKHGVRMNPQKDGVKVSQEEHGVRVIQKQHGVKVSQENHGVRVTKKKHGVKETQEKHGFHLPKKEFSGDYDYEPIKNIQSAKNGNY